MTRETLDFYARHQDCIAQGFNTEENSPDPYGGPIFCPTHFKKALGCFLVDTFDRKYVDYTCGRGTNVLGYANEPIIKAIEDAANRGTLTMPFACDDEVTTAEKMKEFFPFVEVFKFHSSLKEAYELCSAVAMTKTGKTEVALDINKVTEKTACVFIDPTMTENEKANVKLLEYARIKCDDIGALLIFDESFSAFRHKNKSVSTSCGVLPDLLILGGALGGGLYLSAVGGSKELMNSDKYRVTNNFSANAVTLSACGEFLTQIKKKDMALLWESGKKFVSQFNEAASGVARIKGSGTYGTLQAPKEFYQMCADAGIIFSYRWFFSFPLIEETEKTISIVKDVCMKLKTQGIQK